MPECLTFIEAQRMEESDSSSIQSSNMSLGQARRSFTTDYNQNDLSLPFIISDEENREQTKTTTNINNNNSTSSSSIFSKSCQCRVSRFGCIATASAIVLVIGVALLILLNVVGPAIAQSAIRHSTLSLESCIMHDADNMSIALDCHVRLDNAGGIGALLHTLTVDVLHQENPGDRTNQPTLFGHMIMPETRVKADSPTFIRLTTRLNVTDNAAFTRATAGVLQGNVGTWIVRGDGILDAYVGGGSFPFNIHLEKEMLLPPTVLSNVSAFNFQVTGSDANHVYATASCSLLSVSVLELHDLGSMSFAIQSPLDGPNPGAYLGEITMSDFQVKRGYNTYINVTAKIQVDPNITNVNDPKYIASVAGIKNFFELYAKGENIKSMLVGPTWIETGSPFLLNLVTQNVTIINTGPFVSDMETSDIQVHSGTSKILPATAKGTFHSASSILPGALGSIKFELRAPTGTNKMFGKTTQIGEIIMPSNFGVNPGKNYVLANVSLIKDPNNPDNLKAISLFVDKYAEGKNQEMQLFGPIDHPTKILNGFLTQNIIANGISNPNLVVGSVLTQAATAGYPVKGGSAPTVASDGKMRGAVAIAGNPFAASIKMEKVLYDIYLHEPIEYILNNKFWTQGNDLHCPKTNKFARSSFGQGMYKYPYLCPKESCNDPSSSTKDYVNFLPNQQISFLSPAYPMPSQVLYNKDGKIAKCPALDIVKDIMPNYDCCYLSIFAATACRAISKGDAHFLTSTNGSMHLTVGEFETVSSIGQDVLSFTFEAALLDGWKLAGLVTEVPTCKDFTFL